METKNAPNQQPADDKALQFCVTHVECRAHTMLLKKGGKKDLDKINCCNSISSCRYYEINTK